MVNLPSSLLAAARVSDFVKIGIVQRRLLSIAHSNIIWVLIFRVEIFGESCRSPSLFHQKQSFCEPCYSFAPQTHLLHYMGCVKSPQICPREARIFFFCLASGPVNHWGYPIPLFPRRNEDEKPQLGKWRIYSGGKGKT